MIQRNPPAGVIERWQPELDRIAPRTERGHSHLKLMWEPGEDWEPVERWVVWEMMDPWRAPRLGIQEDLDGPPPRAFGRYDWQRRKFVRSRRFTVNQRQWEVHRDTGLFGRPIWIVQGDRGGHKRSWTDVEQNLMMLKLGLTEPIDPPAPGDLAYAEPGERMIDLLHGLDLVHRFGDLLRVFSNDDVLRSSLDAREQETARAMAEQLWHWLGDQVEEAMTLTRKQSNAIWEHANPDKAVPDYDREEDDFYVDVAGATSF